MLKQATWVLVAACAVAAVARAECPVTVDDFTTGRHRVTLKGTDSSVGEVQDGSMVGGYRSTSFAIGSNAFDHEAFLDVRKDGPLVQDTGSRVAARMDLVYGVQPGQGNDPPESNPLDLDVSGCDRFRVAFDANDAVLNVNVVVYWAGGALHASAARNVGPLPAFGGNVDFSFSEFTTSAAAIDWSDIDFIAFVTQSATGIGSNDFAITSLSFRQGP